MSMQVQPIEVVKMEVQRMHSVETQLADALKMLGKMAQNSELKDALEEHRKETLTHVQRIEQVCLRMNWSPIGVASQAIKGLSTETLEALNGAEPCPLTDRQIIAAGQKAEHFEMASYITLHRWATEMGHTEAAELFEKTLSEEQAADEKLSKIADSLNASL